MPAPRAGRGAAMSRALPTAEPHQHQLGRREHDERHHEQQETERDQRRQ